MEDLEKNEGMERQEQAPVAFESTETPAFDDPFYSVGVNQRPTEEPPKKKSKKPLIFLVVALVLVAGGLCTYAFAGEQVANFIAQKTKSPLEYYQWVEERAIRADIELLEESKDMAEATGSEGLLSLDGHTYELKTELVLEQALMQLFMPDLPRQSFGIDALLTGTEDSIAATMRVLLNQVDLLGLDVIASQLSEEQPSVFLGLPDFKEGFFTLGMDDLQEQVPLQETSEMQTQAMRIQQNIAAHQEETVQLAKTLYERYRKLYVDSILEVEEMERREVTIGAQKATYTQLQYTQTGEDVLVFLRKLLAELREDADLRAYVKLIEAATEEEYTQGFDQLIAAYDKWMTDAIEKDIVKTLPITVQLLVDGKGKLAGGTLKVQPKVSIITLDITVDQYAIGENGYASVDLNLGGTQLGTVTYRKSINGKQQLITVDGLIALEQLGEILGQTGLSDVTFSLVATSDIGKNGVIDNIDAELSLSLPQDLCPPLQMPLSLSISAGGAGEDGHLGFELRHASGSLCAFSMSVQASDEVVPKTKPDPIYTIENYATAEEMETYLFGLIEKIDPSTMEIISQYIQELISGASLGDLDWSYDDTDWSYDDTEWQENDTDWSEDDDDTSDEISYADYIRLGAYTGLSAECPSLEVTDEEFEEELMYYRDYGEVETEGHAAERGDTLMVDYTITLDGVEMESQTSYVMDVAIGQGHFPDEFEELLIGTIPGDVISETIHYPQNWRDISYADQDVRIELTVQGVKQYMTLSLTDEFVQEQYGCATVDEFKALLRSYMEKSKRYEAEEAFLAALTEQIWDDCEVLQDLDALILECVEADIALVEEQAAWEEKTLDELLEYYYDMDYDMFYESLIDEYGAYIPQMLILEAVVDAEGLSLTEEELPLYGDEFAESYGYGSYAEISGQFDTADIIAEMEVYRAKQFLWENNEQLFQ